MSEAVMHLFTDEAEQVERAARGGEVRSASSDDGALGLGERGA